MYSFIPNEKLFSLICFFLRVLSIVVSILFRNSSGFFLIVTTAPISRPGLTPKVGILFLDFIFEGFFSVINLRSLNPFSRVSAVPPIFKTTFSILIFFIGFSAVLSFILFLVFILLYYHKLFN